jgi:membrane fusion protein (multidrug efflux system)
MKKRMIIMLVISFIVFGGVVGFYFFKMSMIKKFMSKFSAVTQTISTTVATTENFHPYLTSVGTLQAEQTIEIVPQIAGMVKAIYFQSGDAVKAGTVLVQLDSTNEKAQLDIDVARQNLAQLTYQRDKTLYEKRVISKAQLDTDLSNLQIAKAQVVSDQATLDKMQIKAPFDGVLGIREVNLGEFISPPPATGNIVSLTTIDPMIVSFSLPQQDIPLIKKGQVIQLSVDAFPGKSFEGKITAIDATVSSTNRTIALQATIPNPTHTLVPGLFGTVKVLLPALEKVIVLPQTAIVYSLYGNSVYVVEGTAPTQTVKQVFVDIGPQEGSTVVILKGLEAGTTVVTSGQLKLNNGTAVQINNSVQP